MRSGEEEGEPRLKMTHSISRRRERPLVNYSRGNDSGEEATRTLLLGDKVLSSSRSSPRFLFSPLQSLERTSYSSGLLSAPPLVFFFSPLI